MGEVVVGESNDGVHSAAGARAEFVYTPMCAPKAERNAPSANQSARASPGGKGGVPSAIT